MGRITEIINENEFKLSFEVFPPNKAVNFENVASATQEIGMLHPSFLSVTYGAGGGTSEYTFNITNEVKNKCGITVLPHLTCISSTKKMVREILAKMKISGIENIMALRGDLTPDLEKADRSLLDYQYAVDLVREIKDLGYNFCIGGACYPEKHPESANLKGEIKHLKEKVEAGVEFLTTQMVFDNEIFFNFVYRLRDAGIMVPVVPGIMPITNGKQVEKAIKLSSSHIPMRFLKLVDSFGNDPTTMKQAGIIYATDQIIDLYANGIRNVHVFTMNKPDVAKAIMENVSSILGKAVD